jgi:hypothetical protein
MKTRAAKDLEILLLMLVRVSLSTEESLFF